MMPIDRIGHRVLHRLDPNKRLQAAGIACLVAVSAVAFSVQGSGTGSSVEFVHQSLEATAERATQVLASSVVSTRVAIALENADGLNETAIEFDIEGAQVTLTGEVGHPAEATLAEYVALEVEGVSQVENKLIVVRE